MSLFDLFSISIKHLVLVHNLLLIKKSVHFVVLKLLFSVCLVICSRLVATVLQLSSF